MLPLHLSPRLVDSVHQQALDSDNPHRQTPLVKRPRPTHSEPSQLEEECLEEVQQRVLPDSARHQVDSDNRQLREEDCSVRRSSSNNPLPPVSDSLVLQEDSLGNQLKPSLLLEEDCLEIPQPDSERSPLSRLLPIHLARLALNPQRLALERALADSEPRHLPLDNSRLPRRPPRLEGSASLNKTNSRHRRQQVVSLEEVALVSSTGFFHIRRD